MTSGFESREAHHLIIQEENMNKYFDKSDILFFKITAVTGLIVAFVGLTIGVL